MTSTPSTTSVAAARKRALADEPPLHPHTDLHFWTSTLIFAPHPDDESLGCGGLIALLRERGQTVHIAFVSDGAMSHPNSRRYDRAARVALRRQEATAACAELGVAEDHLTFFHFRDTEVPRPQSPGFDAGVVDIRQLLEQVRPSHVVVPWRRDPHCDHRGTWELCREAISQLTSPPRWVEYPIWMWATERTDELPHPGEVVAWRLDVESVRARKLRAIDQHVSQLTRLIDDDADGFLLTEEMLNNFRGTTELYFEDADKQHQSLSENYFNAVYADNPDPWAFETSRYERDKYEHTLKALPRGRYARGFEIGCSIGVLTALLTERCDDLLAIDTARKPLRRARHRLGDSATVRFAQMNFPHESPAESFDLIVLSEVGYYWSQKDLESAIVKIKTLLRPGGDLVLVHYTPYVPDYPLTGDEVHATFATLLGRHYDTLYADRAERYRIDVFRSKRSG